MRIGRDMALMALGAGAVLAYQRYRKPVMRSMENIVDKTMDMTNDKLGNMM